MTMKRFALLLLPLALLVGGCSTMNARMDEAKLSRPQMAAQPAPEANGSIYQPRQSMFLYEDARARNVGDILTVVQRTQASKSASTSTSKNSSVGMAAPNIFGEPITRNGRAILSADIEGSRSFDGEGGSSQRNQLDGAITVVVVDVLPNGNLVVEGEKWIGINQGEELIKVTGVVRPQDIQNDNSVASTKLGNANISYRGKGALADANAQGWLSRFFNSPIWPF
jgi:flagellar L-ring protein precursor FlgH